MNLSDLDDEECVRMARFQLVEYEDASPEARAIYDDVLATLGTTKLPIWIKALGASLPLLRGNWEKTKAVLATGQVPRLLKELIIFYVSTKRGSEYCSACHAHAALQQDPSLTYRDLKELVNGHEYASMPESFKVALRVAAKSALDPSAVSDDDFRALADAGFSGAEIGELLAQADLAVMFSTITMTYRLPLDPEYVAMMAGETPVVQAV
jgi:alkylhydroperoxidase family enzyme